jgi:hypothetical protein
MIMTQKHLLMRSRSDDYETLTHLLMRERSDDYETLTHLFTYVFTKYGP